MSAFQDLWGGVRSIISGGVKILVGAGKATWALVKFACKTALWVVTGIFTMASAGIEYVRSTIKDFFKPKEIIVVGPKQNDLFAEFIDQKLQEGAIAEDDEELVLEMKERCEKASNNNEILIVTKGVDENGAETLAEPKFVKASDYEQKMKDADENGMLYVKKIKIAS